MTQYYDSNGTYKAYTKDGKNLFSETGEYIGYFMNGFLYNPSGVAIGHIKDKKILDKKGQTIYYSN